LGLSDVKKPAKTDIKVVLDADKNLFVLRIGERTIPMPPRQFEKLVEAALEAAARHINASFRETGRLEKKDEAIEALVMTGMDASADIGAANVVTKVHMGVLTFNFACPRQIALDYCAQVFHCIDQAESDRPQQMN
jgi:hypothetical protein